DPAHADPPAQEPAARVAGFRASLAERAHRHRHRRRRARRERRVRPHGRAPEARAPGDHRRPVQWRHCRHAAVNLALIGPGAMGHEHAKAFTKLDGVVPYLVAGPAQARPAEFGLRHGFLGWTLDPLEAITDPAVDVVVIASPNAEHAEQTRAALRAGKHVLCEIPVALSLADAEDLARLAAVSPKVVMAAHLSRYYPPVRDFSRRIEARDLTLRHLVCAMGTDKREN